MNKLVRAFEAEQMQKNIPDFKPGDTVRVDVKITEGGKTRIQTFEGVVIARRNSGLNETFSVRKVSYGVGIERTFFVHSPNIAKISVVRRGIVSRAKLYYLREKAGKEARIKERKLVKKSARKNEGEEK